MTNDFKTSMNAHREMSPGAFILSYKRRGKIENKQ